MKIRYKLLLAFAGTIILTIGLLGGVIFKCFTDYAIESFQEETAGQLARVDDLIAVHLGNAGSAVHYIATLPAVGKGVGLYESYAGTKSPTLVARETISPASQHLYDVFEQVNSINPLFTSIYIGYEDSGHIVFPSMQMPAGYSPPQREWYKVGMASAQDIAYTQPYPSSDNSIVVSVVAKIRNTSHATIGIAAVDFALTAMTDAMHALRIGTTGYVVVIDGNGMVIVDRENKAAIGRKAEELKEPVLADIAKGEKTFFEASLRNTNYYIKTHVSRATGWRVAVLQEKQEVLANALSTVFTLGYTGLGVLVLVCFIAYFISNSIARPIISLAHASADIAQGNFDSMPDSKNFSGELGILHHNLSSMVANLRTLIETAQEKTREAELQTQTAAHAAEEARAAGARAELARQDGRRQAADLLEQMADSVNRTVDGMNAKLQSITHSLQEQLALASETAAAMEEMNSSITEVAGNAEHASTNAEKAKGETQAGVEDMAVVVRSVEDVMTHAQSTKESLNSLGAQAEAIGRIMVVISDIADQTNLLALNAAIEAARAGDAGRGFAVVADEVRKLAEKTMLATHEVGDSVKGIQQTTTNSITCMQGAEESVARAIRQVEEAETRLAGISEAIDNTSGQMSSIAAAARQQSAASEQVVCGTTKNSELVRGSTECIKDCANQMAELMNNTHSLNALIEDLKK